MRWLTIAFLLLLAAPAGAATLREAPLGTSVDFLKGDRTIVAWHPNRVQTRAMLRDGKTYDVATPECPDRSTATLAGAGGRRLLFACPRQIVFPLPPQPHIVVNPRTGSSLTVLVPTPYDTGASVSVDGIGEHWLRQGVSFHVAAGADYMNWRTGRYIRGAQDPFGPDHWLDLNAASLGRKLCAPFRRTRNDPSMPWNTNADSYGHSLQVAGQWVAKAVPGAGTWTIGRCGSRTRLHVQWLDGLTPEWAILGERAQKRLLRLANRRSYVIANNPSHVAILGQRVVILRMGRFPAPSSLTVARLPR